MSVEEIRDGALILVVDDEPNIRKMLGGVLGDEGYDLALAADAVEARARLADGAVDLILLDVLLPGTDGLALLAELDAGGEHPPVIMMSGHGSIDTALQAVRLGALDFIEKPIQPARLLVSLASAMEVMSFWGVVLCSSWQPRQPRRSPGMTPVKLRMVCSAR